MFAYTLTVESLGMGLISAAVFGLLGVALLVLGFKVFEYATP